MPLNWTGFFDRLLSGRDQSGPAVVCTTAMPELCNSDFTMTHQGIFRSSIAALAALALAGCASEEAASRFLVPPDKYVLYSCSELATASQTTLTRQHELEMLMAKAEVGPGGQLASAMAYRPEYLQLRGEMDQLRKTADEKNCKFVPGGRTSDLVVR